MAAEIDHWTALARYRLGLRPSPARRRSLAATLRAVADQLDHLAEIDERQATRGASARPRGPGRRAGDFVRLAEDRVHRKTRLRLYIGRQLWYALGRPARVDIQRVGGTLRLIPATGDAGWALSTKSGIPRMFVGQDLDDLLRLDLGRDAATIVGEAIVIGARLPDPPTAPPPP
jgi:hypothetical protein